MTKNDLSAGQLVNESDLLPSGSTGGVAAGIPKGLMGMTLVNDEVHGLGNFARGDRFDLVASASFDLQKSLGGVQLSSAVGADSKQAVNQVLAKRSLIVDISEEAAVVALSPSEVAAITKALALGTPLFTIARPSSADDEEASSQASAGGTLVSDPNPLEEIAITQMLIDGKRTMHAYQKPQPAGSLE